MTFTSKFKKVFVSALAAAIFSIGCGETPNQDQRDKRPQLAITSEPATSARVNEDYFYQIESEPAESAACDLISAPKNIIINKENNILYGKPAHVSNENTGIDNIIIKCSSRGYKDAYQEYELKVEPGIFEGKSYDRISHIAIPYITVNGEERIEDIAVLCETNYCPKLYQDDSYWDKRMDGIENSVKALLDVTKESMIREDELSLNYTPDYKILVSETIKRPIKIHLNADSSCDHITGGTSRGNLICDYLYEWINPPKFAWGFSSCLDPRYPEKCVNPNSYRDPSSTEANEIIIHEFNHSINHMKATTNQSELFSYPLGIIMSHNSGNDMTLDSFCDMSMRLQGCDYWTFAPFAELCNNFGKEKFDIDKIGKLYELISKDYSTYNYYDRTFYSSGQLKCALDEIVNADSYNTFVEYFCNNPEFPVYCNFDNTNSLSYIKPYQCRPRVME